MRWGWGVLELLLVGKSRGGIGEHNSFILFSGTEFFGPLELSMEGADVGPDLQGTSVPCGLGLLFVPGFSVTWLILPVTYACLKD
jgi:hypothetical protein